jgi:hypothetical protein
MRSGLSGALLGFVLVFGASIWPIERQVPALIAAQEVVAYLTPEQPVVQQIDLAVVNLQSLTLFVAPVEVTTPITIMARLRLANSGLPPLRMSEQVWIYRPGEEQIRLAFNRIPQRLDPYTTTNRMELVIEVAGTSELSLPLQGGVQEPSAGSLQVGDEVLAGVGLAIQPGYEYRLLDAIWPISAMAGGRSGLFGWPTLYALLAYGVLLGLWYSGRAVVGLLRQHIG